MAVIAKVAVAAATYAIDKPYDYLVPDKLLPRAKVGVRVVIPFGGGNRSGEGLILAVGQGEKTEKLKAITSVLDDDSVLGPPQIKLAYWLRERYFCTLYDAVKVLLPAGLWYRIREVYDLSVSREEALDREGTAREQAVLEVLCAHGGSAELETLKLCCGDDVGPVLRALMEAGVITKQTDAKQKVSDKRVKRISLAVPPEEALAAVEPKKRSAPLRYEVVRLLSSVGSALSSDICYFTGASMATIRSLEKSGLVSIQEEEAYRVPESLPARAEPILLTPEQQAAYEAILKLRNGKTKEQ